MRSQIHFVLAALLAGSVAQAGALGKPVTKVSTGSASVERGTLDMGGGANILSGEGKALTLAEAGYLFDAVAKLISKERDSYYPISQDTEDKVLEVFKALPIDKPQDWWRAVRAQGDRSVFIDRTKSKIDPVRYGTIKDTYRKVIAASGKKLDESAFLLAAYSEGGKTYILPGYEQLTDEPAQPAKYRKALNQIHEFWMRETQDVEPVARLLHVLQFDSIIHKFLTSKRTDEDVWKFHKALEQMPRPFNTMADSTKILHAASRITYQLMSSLETKLGRPPLASQLVLRPTRIRMNSAEELDPALVKSFNTLIPKLDSRFEGAQLALIWSEDAWLYLGAQDLPENPWNYPAWLPRVISRFGLGSSERWPLSEATSKAAEFIKMFDQTCGKHASVLASSRVAGDSLIHFDEKTEMIWSVKCADPRDPTQAWPRGEPVGFARFSPNTGYAE